MGAGKSTVGRALAGHLGWTFVDSDHEIEQRTGADIPWIFEIEGEAGFRDRETQVIDALTQRDGVVLATGGGAIMRDVNRETLGSRGFVVYLAATLREQVRRTGKDSKRPL
jgi:shikimate kinase